MSSTGKTAKLGLNQWVLSDPFNMEDFNSDNAKIETAVAQTQEKIAAAPWQRLLDVTVRQAASTLELNLSGIALGDYLALRLFRITNRSVTQADRWWLRLNKSTGTYYYYWSYGSSWQNFGSFAEVVGGNVEFDLGGNTLYFGNMIRQWYIQDGPKTQELATIDILGSNPAAGSTIADLPIGDRFVLMGVKK